MFLYFVAKNLEGGKRKTDIGRKFESGYAKRMKKATWEDYKITVSGAMEKFVNIRTKLGKRTVLNQFCNLVYTSSIKSDTAKAKREQENSDLCVFQ